MKKTQHFRPKVIEFPVQQVAEQTNDEIADRIKAALRLARATESARAVTIATLTELLEQLLDERSPA